MATKSTFLNRWQAEYYAPVVVTVATAEVERISLENGLLFHELLSAFGRLEGLNGSIKTGSQILSINEAQIRFERISEVVQKSSGVVEEHMREHFDEFDVRRLPSNMQDLRNSPPSCWTPKMEQLLIHSLSFSEFEMASHPLILLTLISTSDEDHVACMRELASVHHLPPCFFTGQYDAEIHRVFVLVHDNSTTANIDVNKMLTKLQATMAPIPVRLLHINSLPATAPNLHQPDIWMSTTHPLFYPQHAPNFNNVISNNNICSYHDDVLDFDVDVGRPIDPSTGRPVRGSRLSLEDFICLRTFCFDLFLQDIIPALERRLSSLLKHVNEHRKGVKNVLKSFWRKPREEGAPVRGQAKYRFDRSESQLLLLADTSFAIRDYETAAAMYRIVREDYRSDKSTSHLAHTTVMLAVCQLAAEPPAALSMAGASPAVLAATALRSTGHYREVYGHLEILNQCILSNIEPSYATAIYAILAAELHTSTSLVPSVRAPVEAAHVLLHAASVIPKLPLLCAILTEKAAEYFLHSGQYRRYAFHQVLAGNKFHLCGLKPNKHAITCFAAAMLIYESGRWGSIKVKLNRAIADELLAVGDDPTRSFVLLLRILTSGSGLTNILLDGRSTDILGRSISYEIMNAVKDICNLGTWGLVRVVDNWRGKTIRQTLLGDTVVLPLLPGSKSEVDGLPVPEVNRSSIEILYAINGYQSVVGTKLEVDKQYTMSNLLNASRLERDWYLKLQSKQTQQIENGIGMGSQLFQDSNIYALANSFLSAENPTSATAVRSVLVGLSNTTPIGETMFVSIELFNRLPNQLSINEISLEIKDMNLRRDSSNKFEDIQDLKPFIIQEEDVIIPGNSSTRLTLKAVPNKLGKYRLHAIKWEIGQLTVRQAIQKDGILLHKTLSQRAKRERAEDSSLDFEVIPARALLSIQFSSIPEEVLQGEVTRGYLILTNEGIAPANNIVLKFSHPFFIVDYSLENPDSTSSSAQILPWTGPSGTIFQLPQDVRILPGATLQLGIWLRLEGGGMQRLTTLASYGTVWDSNPELMIGTNSTRCSSTSTTVLVLPAMGVNLKCLYHPNQPSKRTLVLDISNYLSSTTSPDKNSSGVANLPDDGVLQVDFVQLVGGACSDQSETTKNKNKTKKLEASSYERITLCIPIKVTEIISSSESSKSSISDDAMDKSHFSPQDHALVWSLASEVSWYRDPTMSGELVALMEKIGCLFYTSQKFTSMMAEARRKRKLLVPESAPRSIQSVRRENLEKRTSMSTKSTTSTTSLRKSSDSQNSETMSKPARQPIISKATLAASVAAGTGGSSPVSITPMTVGGGGVASTSPELTGISASALADAQANTKSLTVIVGWICRWKGRVCRGVHYYYSAPLFPMPTAIVSGNPVRMVAADYLSISILHPSRAKLLKGKQHSNLQQNTSLDLKSTSRVHDSESFEIEDKIAFVAIEVELKSNGEQPIIIWADALDWEKGQDQELLNSKKPYLTNEDTLSPLSPVQSCKWLGKVRYESIRIDPFETVRLPFVAVFNKIGLYDLKSFRITVDYADDNFSTPSVKQCYGQNIIIIEE